MRATAVAAGEAHSLVLGDDGNVYGTGSNAQGQIGGQDEQRTRLQPLSGLPSGVHATAMAVGAWHSLVLANEGVVYGSGDNLRGQLTGDRRRLNALTPLSGLPAGSRPRAIAAGDNDSLVIGDDGIIYGTWGNGCGQLTGQDGAVRRTLTPLVWGIIASVTPRIAGVPRVGATLTARHGQWWPVPSGFGYRWLRSGQPVRRATGKTYRVGLQDVGSRIRVQVTALHAGYRSANRLTKQTPPVTRRFGSR